MAPRIRSAARPLATASASSSSQQLSQQAPFARTFTTTPCLGKMTKARRDMFKWLEGRDARALEQPGASPQYLGPMDDQPFPLNPLFRSQPVLSENTRELIYTKVTESGESLKAVSAELGVDVRRVAAVVRLKAVEKQWVATGKKLAKPYAKAVMKMLPQTPVQEGENKVAHEPVNDIHVHKYTMQQLFVPVAESRHFTREDAAAAFHTRMLSADKRSPQPQLIDMERRVLQGATREDSRAEFQEATRSEEESLAAAIVRRQAAEERKTTRVKTDRYEFRFKDFSVQDVGLTGRSRAGTGWRYGAPLMDRKRGQVKIPTSVP